MRPAARTLYCPIDGEDLNLIERMKAATGLTTDAHVVRTALYNFALHLQMAPNAFGLRATRREKASA